MRSLKCLAGFHNWSSWEYQSTGSCTQVRSCVSGRTLSEDIPKDTTLEGGLLGFSRRVADAALGAADIYGQVLVSGGCGESESRIVHILGGWRYEAATSCQLVKICQRCKGKEKGEITHTWGEWEYETATSDQLVKICQRCGAKELGAKDHTWGKWEYEALNSCQLVKICQRCGAEEKGEITHTWGEWQYKSTKDVQQQYSLKLRYLQQLLSKRFSESDVQELCYLLGIEYANLAGEIKTIKVIGLLKSLELHHRIPELVTLLVPSRPDIPWEEMGLLEMISSEQFDIEKLSWEFNPSETCTQIRVCERCNNQEEREQHLWGNQLEYDSPTSCDLMKYCRRCGKSEWVKKEHKWNEGTWSASEDGDACCLLQVCQRCGEEKKTSTEHRWNQWEYESSFSCMRVRKCQRCLEEEVKSKALHRWSEWEKDTATNRLKRICTRCDIVQKSVSGNWSSPLWDLHLTQLDDSLHGILVDASLNSSRVRISKYLVDGEVDGLNISWYSDSNVTLKAVPTLVGKLTSDCNQIVEQTNGRRDKAIVLEFLGTTQSGGYLNISGIWSGSPRFSSGDWILRLKQEKNVVIGTLYVSRQEREEDDKNVYIIEEYIVSGQITGKQISIRFASGKIISKKTSALWGFAHKEYWGYVYSGKNLGRFVGTIIDGGESIEGSYFEESGIYGEANKLTLKLVRSKASGFELEK